MKTFVNPPFSMPEWDLGSGSYGLAHEALRSEVYLNRLIQIGESERFLILDNGADETTVGMSGPDFRMLIEKIKPDVVIAPDVLKDTDATIKNTTEFLEEEWFKEFRVEHEVSVMAVAQGQNFEEWINCYTNFLGRGDIDIIGIPYDIDFNVFDVDHGDVHISEARAKNRQDLITRLYKNGMLLKPIHLLGMNNIRELTWYKAHKIPNIVSNDTTAPFAAAVEFKEWYEFESGEKNWKSLDFEHQPSTRMMEVSATNLMHYFFAAGDLQSTLRVFQFGVDRG